MPAAPPKHVTQAAKRDHSSLSPQSAMLTEGRVFSGEKSSLVAAGPDTVLPLSLPLVCCGLRCPSFLGVAGATGDAVEEDAELDTWGRSSPA